MGTQRLVWEQINFALLQLLRNILVDIIVDYLLFKYCERITKGRSPFPEGQESGGMWACYQTGEPYDDLYQQFSRSTTDAAGAIALW